MKEHKAEKRFTDLNAVMQQYFLVTGRQLEPLPPKPVFSDFYVPSKDHHIVRQIRLKIALNVVKASKLVQMKLITQRSKLGLGHFENFLLLFSRQYGCLRQRYFIEEEILGKAFA